MMKMSSSVQTRVSTLRERYERTRATTLSLAAPLSAEDQMVQSMPDASPTKWHLAHTTWFFETFLLSEHLPGYTPHDHSYRLLFNSYYKSLGGHPVRAQRGTFSRPSLQEVLDYRERVDDAMRRLLAQDLPIDVLALVELGVNHEQQHQELIVTDIKHAFWTQPLRPAYKPADPTTSAEAPEMKWHVYPGGVIEVGSGGAEFAFDNERPRHETLLQPFRLSSRLVTNSEYLDFIEDGGYERPELWLSDGWDTVCAQGWRAPLYWLREESTWMNFTLEGTRPVDRHEPVCHVSYFEADAYARWAGARLPLEHEWESVAAEVQTSGNLLDSGVLHPRVAAAGEQIHPAQLYGDVWEWTGSAYLGYPGFSPAPGAVGEYNGKFMCNQFVLRGGSCATPASHIRATYRNFFPPHARWQFMGIRLASDER